MTGFDEHLESLSALPVDLPSCRHCHSVEPLFLHQASREEVCQKCLAHYLEGDIRDSEDHKARFENYVFQRGPFVGYYEAVSDDDGQCTLPSKDIHDVVEAVLMSKNYI